MIEAILRFWYRFVSEESKLRMVLEDPYFLRVLPNPSEQLQMAAVLQRPYVVPMMIEDVELCPKVQMFLVQKWAGSIRYIKNPAEEVQIAVVSEYPHYFGFIEYPTEAVKVLAALKQ